MKLRLLLLISLSSVAHAEENGYENLYIALETEPGDYPCMLVDSVYTGKRKWIGNREKPFNDTVVGCDIYIPKEEFSRLYEICYLSGIRLPDHHLTSHSLCNYSYPNVFRAEIGKVDSMKGINSITCSFVCKKRSDN
jgi:hypothetical protein